MHTVLWDTMKVLIHMIIIVDTYMILMSIHDMIITTTRIQDINIMDTVQILLALATLGLHTHTE